MMLQYCSLQNGDALPSIEKLKPFKCVVLISKEVSRDWQAAVSEWLVSSGCLYMMAWGRDCISWDDSVDWANIEAFGYENIPDEAFVVTTWHEKDTIEEVLYFAKREALGLTGEIENLLILDIGKHGREEVLGRIYESV